MMFFVINEEIEKVVNVLGVCASNANAAIKVAFGTQEVGDDVRCIAKCIGGTDEISISFLAKKPQNFQIGNATTVAFSAPFIISALTSLLSAKEMIFIDIADDGTVKAGVKDKAILNIPTLGEDQIPAQLSLEKEKQVCGIFVKQSDLITLLKAGFASSSTDANGRGTDNASLVVKDDGLSLYSCNETGSVIGTSSVLAEIKDVPTEDGTSKRAAFCSSKGIKEYIVPIPKKVVLNLLKLLGGDAKCSLVFTDKQICVAPSNTVTYVATLGANCFAGAFQLVNMIDQSVNTGEVTVDSDKLRAGLNIVQQMMQLGKEKNKPVELKFGKTKMMISQTNGQARTLVDLIGSTIEGETECIRFCDAEKVSTILGVLKKGNVKISVKEKFEMPIMFSNGDDSSSRAYLTPVRPAEESSSDETTAEETTK